LLGLKIELDILPHRQTDGDLAMKTCFRTVGIKLISLLK
jgi:hypothetical protein